MLTTRYFAASIGAGAVGAAVLLAGHNAPSAATPQRTLASDVRLSAQAFNLAQVFPWAVGPSTGAAAVSGVLDPNTGAMAPAVAAASALRSMNTLGPVALTVNSIRSISANPAPPGSPLTTTNYTQMDEWSGGFAGLMTSRGALGFTDNTEHYDPLGINHAGVLQVANTLGPAFFDLNVLKAIGFFQGPGGTILPTGHPDNISAVDIGRWNAGIPGLVTNSGTTGFVTIQNTGDGSLSDYRVGGLHTRTQVGSMTFDVNVLPFLATGIIPPAFSFGLSPDMTAADTMFAGLTPPTPGTVQPNGGLPVPPIVTSATSAPVTAPPLAPAPTPLVSTVATEPEAETPVVETARTTSSEPKEAIPGVNGAPLAKTPPKASPTGGSSTPINPFAPLKPFSDMIKSGISSFTGTGPASSGVSGGAGSDAGSAGGSGDGGE
jgi:hypothetical protein